MQYEKVHYELVNVCAHALHVTAPPGSKYGEQIKQLWSWRSKNLHK